MKTREAMPQIRAFAKYYPATVKAAGGPEGLLRWSRTGRKPVSTRTGRIFLAENSRIVREREQWEALEVSELWTSFLAGCARLRPR